MRETPKSNQSLQPDRDQGTARADAPARVYDATSLTQSIRDKAFALGFSRIGCCAAVTPTGLQPFLDWIDQGYAGEMAYLHERRQAYHHPDSVLDGCRSIVGLAVDYQTATPKPKRVTAGRVSRYAWGPADYHDVIHRRLKQIRRELIAEYPGVNVRGVVDTAPLLERDFARLAGLGWQGKNTMLISRTAGSWFFLAFLLVDQALDYDPPMEKDHCGSCTACLDACPTQAFPRAGVLDARKCLSYRTIEFRGVPPESWWDNEDWLFGCDICQEVCPWNRFAPTTDEPAFSPTDDHGQLDLVDVIQLDESQFRRRFRKTALWRTKRQGLVRNALVLLSHQNNDEAIETVAIALKDPDEVVRATAVLALRKMLTSSALLSKLADLRESETSALVNRAIVAAESGQPFSPPDS